LSVSNPAKPAEAVAYFPETPARLKLLVTFYQ
jgi:hypothetical protein